MKPESIFNKMGFSGQLGKLGSVIRQLRDDVNGLLGSHSALSDEVGGLSEDLGETTETLGGLSELVDKLKALINVTVTFDSNEGSTVTSQTIPFGTKATVPEQPTKDGWLFFGWRVNGVLFDFENPITENITITANWIEAVTVTFDSNGGSLVDSVTIPVGASVVAPEPPTWEGYIFAGWYLDNIVYDFDSQLTEDITLVADWMEDGGGE